MKLITLASCLLLPDVGAANSNDLMDSIGMIDTVSFHELLVREGDCDGVYSGRSGHTASAGRSSMIVTFDYDVLVGAGTNVNIALSILQNRLLRRVGRDVFSGCSSGRRRRLEVGGDLDPDATEGRRLEGGIVIEEISTVPSDRVSASVSCKMESSDAGTDFYPISGHITAYHPSPSSEDEDARRLYDDVSVLRETITASVKSAMDDSDRVFYLGDREAFAFDSSESHLTGSPTRAKGAVRNGNESASGGGSDRGGAPIWPVLVGVGEGVVATAGAALLLKKRRSERTRREIEENQREAVVDYTDVEVGQEEPTVAPQEEEETATLEPR